MLTKAFFSTPPVILAPMAGYTDGVFRRLCASLGCDLAFTEMISAKGLLYKNEKTRRLFLKDPLEGPLGVQLFGSDPAAMGEAARILCGELGDSLFCIDINAGCPAKKIAGSGDGCALMLDLPLAGRIVSAVVKNSSVPVTVKFRKGFDEAHLNAVAFAKTAEEAGAFALTVHPRTRTQQYSGLADHAVTRQVAEAVSLPVIGNGDVTDGEKALALLQATGCSGVMVGRGALGNPWIFREIKAAFSGEKWTPPSLLERRDMALTQALLSMEAKGPHGLIELRKQLPLYFTGEPRLKKALGQVQTPEELQRILLDSDFPGTYNSMT